jgi:uncharacterized protein (TIGR03067 family)
MKPVLTLRIAACSALAVAALPAHAGAPKGDRLEGIYRLVECQIDGAKFDGSGRAIITNDNMSLRISGGRSFDGPYTVDSKKKPKAIDWHGFANRGLVMRGIYRVDRDTLWICVGQTEGVPRPLDFTSPPGGQLLLVGLRKSGR